MAKWITASKILHKIFARVRIVPGNAYRVDLLNGGQVAATASITPLAADWALGVHHYDLVCIG